MCVTGALKSKGMSGPTYRKEEDISGDERCLLNCQTPYPLGSKSSSHGWPWVTVESEAFIFASHLLFIFYQVKYLNIYKLFTEF